MTCSRSLAGFAEDIVGRSPDGVLRHLIVHHLHQQAVVDIAGGDVTTGFLAELTVSILTDLRHGSRAPPCRHDFQVLSERPVTVHVAHGRLNVIGRAAQRDIRGILLTREEGIPDAEARGHRPKAAVITTRLMELQPGEDMLLEILIDTILGVNEHLLDLFLFHVIPYYSPNSCCLVCAMALLSTLICFG